MKKLKEKAEDLAKHSAVIIDNNHRNSQTLAKEFVEDTLLYFFKSIDEKYDPQNKHPYKISDEFILEKLYHDYCKIVNLGLEAAKFNKDKEYQEFPVRYIFETQKHLFKIIIDKDSPFYHYLHKKGFVDLFKKELEESFMDLINKMYNLHLSNDYLIEKDEFYKLLKRHKKNYNNIIKKAKESFLDSYAKIKKDPKKRNKEIIKLAAQQYKEHAQTTEKTKIIKKEN